MYFIQQSGKYDKDTIIGIYVRKVAHLQVLLLLRLSGAYLIIQMGLYLEVNTLLGIYKSRYNSINEKLC